jgi:DNA (cytosine-5)-methyltransferase 1
MPRILSLCSGYGGIEIGLERIFGKISTLAYVEIEAYATAVLVDKMEAGRLAPAPIWTDIKTFNAKIFRGAVDILCGGYPCQPFSAAGKRKGKKDPRHLWPHIQRIIKECQPRYCFFENVEGHISLGLEAVLSDLGKLGYRVEAGIFSATEVGAPHQRKRVFILANSSYQNARLPIGEIAEKSKFRGGNKWPARPGQPQYEWEEPRTIMDDT